MKLSELLRVLVDIGTNHGNPDIAICDVDHEGNVLFIDDVDVVVCQAIVETNPDTPNDFIVLAPRQVIDYMDDIAENSPKNKASGTKLTVIKGDLN